MCNMLHLAALVHQIPSNTLEFGDRMGSHKAASPRKMARFFAQRESIVILVMEEKSG